MNRTVKVMKTDAKRIVSKIYTIKVSDVAKNLNTEHASLSNLSARLSSKGRPISMTKFKYQQNTNAGMKGGQGVRAKIKKDSGFKEVNNDGRKAFVGTMRNGSSGIFIRKDSKKIKKVLSPAVTEMLNQEEAKEQIQKSATDRFGKELNYQINYLLTKL